MSTALIYSDDFLKHETGQHPERRERYLAALGGLLEDEDLWSGLVKLAPRMATDDEVLRCHSHPALDRIAETEKYDRAALDQDTVTCRDSAQVARLAAGGACRAIDAVVRGDLTNTIKSLEVQAGAVALKGPGLTLTLDDAASTDTDANAGNRPSSGPNFLCAIRSCNSRYRIPAQQAMESVE